MSWDLVLRHCAALRAQIDGLEAYVKMQAERDQRPRAVLSLPELCKTYKAEDCARRCDEAANELGGMGGGPRSFMCRGCGEVIPIG